MKKFHLMAKFPQALCKHTFQAVMVNANSYPVALNKGMKLLLKRDGIKGGRHKVVTVTIQVQEEGIVPEPQ